VSWGNFPLALDFRFWLPLLSPVSILAFGLAGATFWETFFPHRAILFTIAGQHPLGTGGDVKPDLMFKLPVIVSNTGNRPEIILCIGLAVIPSAPPNNEYQSSLSGPYILKAGDAVTTSPSLSFQKMQSIGTGNTKDVSVHVVTISPENNIIGVDIPVSRLNFSQMEGKNTYTEQGNPEYREGLTDIFAEHRSNFTNCMEGISTTIAVQFVR
jgi:hypothetical protein